MTSPAFTHVAIERAAEIADDVLFPHAQERDRASALPHDGLDALAAGGLFGIAGPSEFGGLALDPIGARRVIATVGGGCGATFFVWVQHHGVVRDIAASDNAALRDGLIEQMCAGEVICGTAFAHVRRRGEPAVRATRTPDGWRLDGFAPWATSWGIAPRFSIYAVAADGTLVKVMVPGAGRDGDPPGITSIPLHLAVLGSTGTVALRFDGCEVADGDVIGLDDHSRWLTADRERSAIGQPATLGVAERATATMRTIEDDHAQDAANGLAAAIDRAWQRDRQLTGDLVDGVTGDRESWIATASDHRASCLLLAQAATTAAVAAAGGRAMDLDHPGQRLAREASFYTIQAQTADGRAATLRSVTSRVRPRPRD
ncbi:MAG: acyl-CoA dehydrogenase family protein [Actinomycetota bacterium]